MRNPTTQLPLQFNATDVLTSCLPADEHEFAINIERPDLSPRGFKARSEQLSIWRRWWSTSGCNHAIESVPALVEYARHIERSGRSSASVDCAFQWIGHWLKETPRPDPAALRMVEQVRRSAKHAYRDAMRQTPVPIFGREQIDALIDAADPLSPQDCRDLSALLILYETMAAPDQVFGYQVDGQWKAPPLRKDALSFQNDGTCRLELKAVTKSLARSAVLSSKATQWLCRWLESRTDSQPELFFSKTRPLSEPNWRISMRDLALRAGFHPPFRFRGLRRSHAHELVSNGAKSTDLLRVTSWRTLHPIRRAKRAINSPYPQCLRAPKLQSLSCSSRRRTRMRAYSSDLFAKSC